MLIWLRKKIEGLWNILVSLDLETQSCLKRIWFDKRVKCFLFYFHIKWSIYKQLRRVQGTVAHFHRLAGDQRHLAFLSFSFSFFSFSFLIVYGIPLGIFKTCFAIFGCPPAAYLIHISPNTHLIWKSGYSSFVIFTWILNSL